MAHDLDKLIKEFLTDGAKKLPPVASWQPEIELTIDIRIDSEGQWFHEGTAFEREDLMRLFASILRFENNQYYLVTPREKFRIEVADVPFVINSIRHDGDKLFLVTQCEDVVELGAELTDGAEEAEKESGWQLREYQSIEIPYLRVRENLYARLSRSVFYQLIELALEQKPDAVEASEGSDDCLVLMVNGCSFPLGRLSE
jgi:hypothetical protein